MLAVMMTNAPNPLTMLPAPFTPFQCWQQPKKTDQHWTRGMGERQKTGIGKGSQHCQHFWMSIFVKILLQHFFLDEHSRQDFFAGGGEVSSFETGRNPTQERQQGSHGGSTGAYTYTYIYVYTYSICICTYAHVNIYITMYEHMCVHTLLR